VLLNTLGKLIEKMLACRLQFDGVAHGAFEPNQFGGIAQHSTEDAGVYLTHLVRVGWAKGLQTSVVAFDIAQFFPSLNHDILLEIISQLGFPVEMGPFHRFFFFFFVQQFITRGSTAVCGWHIQTLNTLRLHYAVPVMYYQNLEASFWQANVSQGPQIFPIPCRPFER
jgi:hypothetical protein